jgi:hypothetical protein
MPNTNPAATGYTAPGAAPAVGAPAPGTAPGTGPGAPSQTTLDEATRTKLLGLMNPTGTDAATLATSPEAAAERFASQRAAEGQTAQAAEQDARNGTSGSGGAAGIARGITQNQGGQDTQFLGQLAQQKKSQDIQQTQFALTQAQQSGQFEKAQALSQQLAHLQAGTATGIAQIGANTAMGINENNLGYSYTALQQQANQQALLAMLGGGTGTG